jgi:hypothetical protein
MRNLLPPLGVQLLVVVLHANRAHPHSITVVPMSRNAVDNRLPLWRDGAAPLSNGASGLAATGRDAGLGLCNETTEGLFSNSSAYCSGCFCSNSTSPCAAGQTCVLPSAARAARDPTRGRREGHVLEGHEGADLRPEAAHLQQGRGLQQRGGHLQAQPVAHPVSRPANMMCRS